MKISTPDRDCDRCPRLAAFLSELRVKEPHWFNAPVPPFGPEDAELLIVGLAPGMKGANRTGRPFTGDFAGDLLYDTLAKFGYSVGTYAQSPNDGMSLVNCRITNAVKCLPPQNKPIGAEIRTCRDFLIPEIMAMKNLKIILALGRIAHDSLLATFQEKRKDFPFSHAGSHRLSNGLMLIDSYHCSRYNTNTGRLTVEMFDQVFEKTTSFLAK